MCHPTPLSSHRDCPCAFLKRSPIRVGAAVLVALGVLGAPRMAFADQAIIKFPGMHAAYSFEAEPHLVVDPFHHFVPGIGFRGTVELVDNGFIKSINNTVGLGFGADWTNDRQIRMPVVMQWNFWLSRNWSVFGEPGGELRFDNGRVHGDPVLFIGGRFHFSDAVTLTMRAGHPVASVGVSFLL